MAAQQPLFDTQLRKLRRDRADKNGTYDLAIHGLSAHSANDPVGQFVQLRHALKPDGLMLVVMFGGQTLHELRASLKHHCI